MGGWYLGTYCCTAVLLYCCIRYRSMLCCCTAVVLVGCWWVVGLGMGGWVGWVWCMGYLVGKWV